VHAPMTRNTDSIFSGIFSWQIAVALVGAVLFWFSIIRPDSVAMLGDRSDAASLGLCSVDLLEKIKQSKPIQLLHKGQNDQAVVAAKEALAKHPYDVMTVIVAGNVDCAAGKKEEGLALLRKSTFLCPQSRYVGLNYARGLAGTGNTPDALDKYWTLAQTFPNEWAAPRLELADILLQDKQPALAVERLKEVVAADGKNGYARRKLGLAMAAVGDSKQGFEEFIKGCALESEQGPPPDLQAFIDKIGNHNKAEEELKHDIANNPGDTANVILLAELLVNADRLKEARGIIYAPLQNPQSALYKIPEAHFLQADIANQSGDTEQALMEFRRGAKIITGIE
jgi:predicted Zn-dependent protease